MGKHDLEFLGMCLLCPAPEPELFRLSGWFSWMMSKLVAPSSGSAKQCDLILLQYQNNPIYAIYIEGGGIIIKLCNWEALDHLYLERSSSKHYSVLIRLVIYNGKFLIFAFFITRKPEALYDMVCLCPFIIWDGVHAYTLLLCCSSALRTNFPCALWEPHWTLHFVCVSLRSLFGLHFYMLCPCGKMVLKLKTFLINFFLLIEG